MQHEAVFTAINICFNQDQRYYVPYVICSGKALSVPSSPQAYLKEVWRGQPKDQLGNRGFPLNFS